MPLLHWLTRDDDIHAAAQTPYRLLEEVASQSQGDRDAGNMLIQGDNLDALKALLPYYAGRVKCIFIDPPYNTRSAFEHYDDNLEHAQWLAMMYPRLDLLHQLLTEDGSIWVTLDDNEAHYLKVVIDEIFGRRNFIIDLSWQKRDGPPNDRKVGLIHDHVLIWAKRSDSTSSKTLAEDHFNLMERTEKADAQYRVFAEPTGPDARGPFRKIDTTANGKGGRMVDSLVYPIVNPYTKQEVLPRAGTCWRHNKEEMARLQADKRLYWGVKGDARTPMRKLFKFEDQARHVGSKHLVRRRSKPACIQRTRTTLWKKASFETPKPEGLMKRLLEIATNPGDLVLDSFLGSGTTAAVAHKMGRHYIGIEMGDHAMTHCVPRSAEGHRGRARRYL